MNIPKAFLSRAFVLALSLAPFAEVGAVGFRHPNQDPEGIARGNAFAATADNPSAIYYNPAGITQLEGHQVSVGVYAISTDVDYRALTGPTAGLTANTDTGILFGPQIHYVYSPPDSPWSYGLGLYTPYGLGIDYGSSAPFATVAEEATLAYVTLNPVLAYQVSPCLSVAAGLTINYSEIDLERQVTGPGDSFNFDGDGHDFGINLGLLWQPTSQWSFGLNFRSETDIKYKGDSIVSFDPARHRPTSGSLNYPYFIVGGVSYRPNENWNFEFNLDWTNWNSLNEAVLKGTFGGDQTLSFHYESSFMYNFGATRYLQDGYFVSAGYIYSENSAPDSGFTPLNPDSNLHLGSIGFGKRGDDWSWAFGYHFAYNDGRTVSGSAPSLIGLTADGEYETFNHAFNLAVRRSF